MEKYIMIKKPSSMGKEQLLLLKKGMSKKAYKEYCRKYRSSLMLGRNYGTRRMASVRDYDRKRRSAIPEENVYKLGGNMITFNEKRQAFINMMRAKMPVENTSGASKTECAPDEKVDDELMDLLEKKFEELFGPIDDD